MIVHLTIDSVLPLVQMALQEDIASGDITTESIFDAETPAEAAFLVKQNGVVSGLSVAAMVFDELSGGAMRWEAFAVDGEYVRAGTVVARVAASTHTLLKGERTALNFMQRMSGVSTQTHRYAEAIAHTAAKVCDTRKTIPLWRLLDKYAVRMGGGINHRFGLFDMILIKDNHRDAAGSITEAVRRANSALHDRPNLRIEVETRTTADIHETLACLDAGLAVHTVMFDNFTPDLVRQGVEIVGNRLHTEASGGITLDNIRSYAETGINTISVGALTHSAPALDISMKFVR